jgi:hypothetical protein
MVVKNVATAGLWIRRPSQFLAGFITIARMDANMNGIRNGRAICNKNGRSAASTIARKISAARCGIQNRSPVPVSPPTVVPITLVAE